MDFLIREANITDTEMLYELNRNELKYDYCLEDTKKQLQKMLNSNEDKIFVALCDETVVAYVHARSYDILYSDHMKDIMGIAVAENYKHKGIGRALLKEVEQWALQSNACGIRLVSGSTREGAHEFYRHCGFDEEKQQINFKKFL